MKSQILISAFMVIMTMVASILSVEEHEIRKKQDFPPEIMPEDGIPADFDATECYNQIIVKGKCKLILVQGATCGYKIQNAYEKEIEVSVKGELLYIETIPRLLRKSNISVFAAFNDLKSLEIDGSAAVYNNPEIELEKLDIDIDGTGDLYLAGKAKQIDLNINDAGNAMMIDFKSDVYNIQINGSGDAYIDPVEKLDAQINGEGNIFYLGEPSEINQSVNGVGKIEEYLPEE